MTRMSQLFTKKMIAALALLLAVIPMSAGNVDAVTAQETASMFINSMASHPGRRMAPTAAANVRLIHTELNSLNSSQAVYYIFNTDDSFIIVSGDDRARDIIAYGDAPLDMNQIPEAMQFMLNYCKKQLEYLQGHPDMVVKKSPRRESIDVNMDVEPLISTFWDQSEPYNNHCPEYNGKKLVTGCGATALAMIFHYWKYPTEPTPAVPAYTTYTHQIRLNELPSTTFDWDNMLVSYWVGASLEQTEAVSWLMRYIGQAEKMDYTSTGSGTTGESVLRAVKFFGYDANATLVKKTDLYGRVYYKDPQWAQMIQDELYSGRPVAYGAYDQDYAGHEFIVDGYDAVNDMYHINWGWSGAGNSHFALNDFSYGGSTYNLVQDMIVGLEPAITEPTIQITPSKMKIDAYVDSSATKTFTVKGILLTDDVTLTLEDDTDQFSLDKYQIDQQDLDGRMKKVTVTVTYTPQSSGVHMATLKLTSADAKEITATIYGQARLETYNPVIVEPSEVTMSSFRANWEDSTPVKNVDRYMLQLAKVPYSQLVIEEAFDAIEYSGTGTSDYSSKLDELTAVPGWTASKVYRSNNHIAIGASKSKGWIQTPPLDTRGNNGYITVKVKAQPLSSSVDDAPLKITCGDNDTIINVTSADTVHTLLIPCLPGLASTVKFANNTVSKRILLCDVEIYSGDKLTPADFDNGTVVDGITTTSCQLTGLNAGFYDYRVMAYYTDGTMSSWSNNGRVFIQWPVGDLNMDAEVSLADINRLIAAILDEQSQYYLIPSVADINGDGEISLSDINVLIDIILSE